VIQSGGREQRGTKEDAIPGRADRHNFGEKEKGGALDSHHQTKQPVHADHAQSHLALCVTNRDEKERETQQHVAGGKVSISNTHQKEKRQLNWLCFSWTVCPFSGDATKEEGKGAGLGLSHRTKAGNGGESSFVCPRCRFGGQGNLVPRVS